jgi:hypothetical protein
VQPLAQPRRKRVWLPHEAPIRLAELGLEAQYFHDALTEGHHKSKQVGGGSPRRKPRKEPDGVEPVGTGLYPLNYPGIVMWAESLKELRSILLRIKGADWAIGRSGNYETVYSPSRGIGIAIHSGDRWAGVNAHHEPKLKRGRGRMAIERGTQNELYVQMELFPVEAGKIKKAKDEAVKTYFLLPNAREDDIALELSLPTTFGPNGQVEEWKERILITPVPISNAVQLSPLDEDDDDEDDTGRIVDRPD